MNTTATPADRQALSEAARRLHLAPGGAELISHSSRAVWHLPHEDLALFITKSTRPSFDAVLGEVRAVQAAIAAGVRTPPVLAGPVQLESGQGALGYRWIEHRNQPVEPNWAATAEQAARLASARNGGIPRLRMNIGTTHAALGQVLGRSLSLLFERHWRAATATVRRLLDTGPLVLCHGDLHPGNLITDYSGQCWLVDFEYSCQGPREWDPAKVIILANRFGDPPDPAPLLAAWRGQIDPARLGDCVTAQETLLVGWLAAMALQGTPGAEAEARRRAASLGQLLGRPWRHLAG